MSAMRKLTVKMFYFTFLGLSLLENTFAMHENEDDQIESQKIRKDQQPCNLQVSEDQKTELPQDKLKFISKEFMTLNFGFNFEGKRIVVRPLKITDVNEIFIDRFCMYDPTDPMDEGSSNEPRPSIKEIQDPLRQLLESDMPQQAIYGIFDSEDDQMLGKGAILRGKRFYNAYEITFLLHSDYRGKGLGKAVAKGFLDSMKRTVSNVENCPVRYIEGSINDDNIASQRASIGVGMIKFQKASPYPGTSLYYYPLQVGLSLPTVIPPKNRDIEGTEEVTLNFSDNLEPL